MSGIPEDIEIVFEDAHLVALVKPAGLPTANAPAGAPSVYAWLKRRLGRGAFVGVVSRLDAPVSGLVVMAKTPRAAAALAAQFRERSVDKAYAAVVGGRFPAPCGAWVDWHDRIDRRAGDRRSVRCSAAAADAAEGTPGLPAHVRARVVRRSGEVSLVDLEPSTGRRHQLRLQLAARGCPIVGDRRYGSRLPFPDGIALHAARLALDHPASRDRLEVAIPHPPAWRREFAGLLSRTDQG